MNTRLPLPFILLDFLGVLLVGLGMAMHFAEVDILPARWRFAQDGLVLIVVGFALMLPAIVHLLKHIRQRP